MGRDPARSESGRGAREFGRRAGLYLSSGRAIRLSVTVELRHLSEILRARVVRRACRLGSAAAVTVAFVGCTSSSDAPRYDRFGRPLNAQGEVTERDAAVSLTQEAQGERYGGGEARGGGPIIVPRNVKDEPEPEPQGNPVMDHVKASSKLRRAGDLPGAIASMKKAWLLDKEDPDIATALGQLYQENDQLRFAETAYKDAVALDPKHVDARYGLGMVLLKRGMAESARTVLEALAKDRPDDRRLMDALAAVRSKSGDNQAAIEALQKKAEAKPEDVATQRHLGNALAVDGRYGDAAKALGAAAKAKPDDPTVQLQLGAALAQSGDLKGAESALSRSAALAPKDARAWQTLAAVRENLGDAEGAAKAYEQMLQNVDGADPDGALAARIKTLRTSGLAKKQQSPEGAEGSR